MRYVVIILFLSCLGAAASLAQDPDKKPADRDMIGTSISRRLCKPAKEQGEEVLICKGFGDYSLQLKGDETKPQISLIAPDGTLYPIHYWDLNDPAFRGLEENVLWIVNHREKTLAINLRLKVELKEGDSKWGPYDVITNGDAKWGRYDVIARITPLPVCVVGSVPVRLKTGGQSMFIAISPAARPCLAVDELVQKD